MRYVDFYRMFGTRKMSEFYTPKVFNKADIHLPKFSTLYLYNVDMDLNTPKKEGILAKPHDVIVKTINKYGKETMGNFRELGNRLPIYIKECKNNEPKINFLKNNAFVMKADSVLVKNFLGLNNFYRYSSNPLLPHWRFYNTLSTVIEEVNKELDRNIFIPIDIDINIKYVNFRILLEKKVTSGLLHLIPNYNTLLLFELWKLLDPTWRERSMFNKISLDKIKNVNLVLNTNTKCCIVNLEVLLSTIAEYKDFNYKINKLPYKTVSKLIYLAFRKIVISDILTPVDNNVNNFTEETTNGFRDVDLDEDLDFLEEDIEDNIELSVADGDVEVNEEIINNSDIDTIEVDTSHTSIEDTLKAKDTKAVLVKKIETLKDNGLITKVRGTSYLEMVEKQDEIPVIVNGKEVKLGNIINHKSDYSLKEEHTKIEPSLVVSNKDYLKNTIVEATKRYVKEDHEINLVKSMVAVKNADIIINNFELVHEENILGKTSKYKMEVTTLEGSKSTLEVILPKVEENGTYRSSNNTYIMRRQKNDLPIRKINYNEVVLNSFYGKTFITRATQKNNDEGYWLKNRISKMYADGLVTNLVTREGKSKVYDKKLPDDYSAYGRYLKSFKYQDYSFNFVYDSRIKLVNDTNLLNKLEYNGIVIGKKGNNFLVMNYNNKIFEFVDNKFVEIGHMWELINLDIEKLPVEYINTRVFKMNVPIVFLLGYYFGSIEKLFKTYKVEFYYEKSTTRIDKNKYHELKLSNDKLVFRKNKKTDLIFGGLLTLSNYSKMITRLNNKNDFDMLFNTIGYSLLVKNEIPNLNNLFIDPITLDILKLLHLPETFSGLLIKAVEMLEDDNYKNPNSTIGTSLKGYERMSGMVYRELCVSIRDYKNRSVFGRSKITINPYCVIKKLNEDSTTMLVNDINPIANLKQYEDVTLLGAGGLSKESVNKDKRQYDTDDIGIISEANKDSGDVGISAYLSATPGVTNKLGMVEAVDIENGSWSNIFSTSAMLAPFGINDDMKRLVFSGIQNEHVIPTLNMRVPYVRTPYDLMIASRLQDKYCTVAEASGEVTKVTDKVIVVRYQVEASKITYTKEYKLYSWYSKIESNSTFKHTIVSNVIKGEKVKKDDVLCYDNAFFIPDLYDKTRVVYIQSTFVNLAFIDDIDTYEDSTTLSYELSELMSINAIKLKSNRVKAIDNIIDMVNVGDKVIPTTSLYSITNQIIDLSDLDEEAIETFKNMNSTSPKAKYTGIIDNIVIYYNCSTEDLSPTLKELVKISDAKLLEDTGHTGRVNSSYSIKGVPLMEGEVEMRVFISIKDDMAIADKMIWGNQMKCTVGGLFKKITTFDTNEVVDATFSSMSIAKRITPSVVKMGVLGSIAKKIENTAVSIYFK